MNKTCATCVYFDDPHCVRHAPVPVASVSHDAYGQRIETEVVTQFPVVSPECWCGEWSDAEWRESA